MGYFFRERFLVFVLSVACSLNQDNLKRFSMSATTPIVSIVNVSKDYSLGKTIVPALQSVNLTVALGDFISIAGPSGSGKTTLLNLIGCVDTATSGQVIIADHDTKSLRERQLTDLRLNTIGFIFQSFNLVPVLSVFQNVEFPLLLQKKLVSINIRSIARASFRADKDSVSLLLARW
jgi:ABC-type lipoprotein export system ATPase subunit